MDKHAMDERALELNGIEKSFPGVRALDGASLSLRPGEVHGLVGENGAGKSTIIKVLAGVYTPDGGSISIAGAPLTPLTPGNVHAAGVRFIHQELNLVPHFSVTESVFMGQEVKGRFGLDRRAMRSRAERFLRDTLAVEIDGNTLIRDLGTAERKLVQVARALIDEQARVVVFDEPTAPLASEEVRHLMEAITRLKARGIAILYVSHYLSEITDICDRVTVFRQGRDVAEFDEVSEEHLPDIIAAMVGRKLEDLYPPRRTPSEAPMLELKGLSGQGFADIDLTLHRGEILGIAGLIGSGREELISTIYGQHQRSAGEIVLDGRKVKITAPSVAVENGIVLVPRDRRNDGLVLSMNLAENVTLASLEKVSRFGLESRRRTRAEAAKQIAALDIRPPIPTMLARLMSGGNQQKVVLARWLECDAPVFLLDGPTVGVDVGARAEIYMLIDRLARQGAAVLLSSSDPAELLGVCDRVAVMMRGRITRVLDTAGLSLDALVAATTGAADAANGLVEAADV